MAKGIPVQRLGAGAEQVPYALATFMILGFSTRTVAEKVEQFSGVGMVQPSSYVISLRICLHCIRVLDFLVH